MEARADGADDARVFEQDIQHLPDEHFDSMVNALQACLDAKSGDDSQVRGVRVSGVAEMLLCGCDVWC